MQRRELIRKGLAMGFASSVLAGPNFVKNISTIIPIEGGERQEDLVMAKGRLYASVEYRAGAVSAKISLACDDPGQSQLRLAAATELIRLCKEG